MSDLTTEQHAQRIAESLTNGQRKQAIEQFNHARGEGCTAAYLLIDIESQGIDTETIFRFIGALLDNY